MWFELIPLDVVSGDDRTGASQAILKGTYEIQLDQKECENRIANLTRISHKVKRNVTWIGLLGVLIAWIVIILQNFWLTTEVRKRM